ncbi:MAG: response regulator, partial [Pedobacter sp.]|nr:response regulator [Pedobacter sp.]
MKKYIQIVEDDGDIRFIVEYILSDANYVVESFENATSFKNRTHTTGVDLIILDVMLPDGNGIDLCQNLKSDDTSKHIPIIVMSAHAGPNSILEEACADDFINK